MSNLELVKKLCDLVDDKTGNKIGNSQKLIQFVKDRPGHDQRYAIDASKIKEELNWEAKTDVDSGLENTIDWYLNNKSWLENVTSGAYLDYYQKHYQS